MRTRIWSLSIMLPLISIVAAQQRTIPTPPQLQQTAQRTPNSRPAQPFIPGVRTQPPRPAPTSAQRVQNPPQPAPLIRPRFQPQPPPLVRRPANVPPPPPIQRTPAAQLRPSNAPPPQISTVRRQPPTPTAFAPSPQQSLQIRPLATTPQRAPQPQPSSRPPVAPSRPPQTFPSQAPTLRSQSAPNVARPSQPLPPHRGPLVPSAATVRRPIPSTPQFANTNSLGPAAPTSTPQRPIAKPRTSPGAHPPSPLPPSNSIIDELNHADDFMAVAARLKLRRFARHRNRRHADFIYRQLTTAQ